MLVAKLPGSIYATEVTTAGPKKGKKLRKPRRRPSSTSLISSLVRSVRLGRGEPSLIGFILAELRARFENAIVAGRQRHSRQEGGSDHARRSSASQPRGKAARCRRSARNSKSYRRPSARR